MGNAADNDDACPFHWQNAITLPRTCQAGYRQAMTRDAVNKICAALPGADWSEPFGPGHDVWKVGDKIFAAIGAKTPGVSVKTPDIETATMLIEAGVGVKAPYFHRSWVNIPFDTDPEELTHRIRRSYALVRGSLTKKVQAALPAFADQA